MTTRYEDFCNDFGRVSVDRVLLPDRIVLAKPECLSR